MSAAEDPILHSRDGAVTTFTLNRPDQLNALDFAMIDRLVDLARRVAEDATVRCVVVQGAGRHFMAGGDLRAFATRLPVPREQRAAEFARVVDRVHAATETLLRMDKPVVASVRGAVAGFGLSLMLACDLAVAARDAYFSTAYATVGLSPDGGLTWTLPRLVGTKRAMELAMLAERFDAQQALALGLVNRVVAPEELAAATQALARRLAAGPATALAGAKRLIAGTWSRTLPEQLHAEAASFGRCTGTADFEEGLAAFFEKRPARFG